MTSDSNDRESIVFPPVLNGAGRCAGVRRAGWLAFSVLLLAGAWCSGAARFEPVYGDPMLEPWRWRTFPELSGLGAQCMAEGPGGTIWFGATEGVWSFDGMNWVFYPPENGIGTAVSIARDPSGDMWFASRWEIWRFGNNKLSRVFRPTNGRFGEFQKIIVTRDGVLWAATAWGAICCRGGEWTLYTGPEIIARVKAVRCEPAIKVELMPEAILNAPRTNTASGARYDLAEVQEDRDGRIWFGTDRGEIICLEPAALAKNPGGAWRLYNELHGIACGRSPSILVLQNGAIWVTYDTGSGYLNVFDGGAWSKSLLADAGVPGDSGHLIQTRDGVVWMSSRYIVSACRNGHWTAYQKPKVPIPSAHNVLMQSSDGALWIAGPGTEIVRVDYQTGRWLTLSNLNFQWESPAGDQWFLHRDGRVVCCRSNAWTSYGTNDGVVDSPVALLGTRSGDVWVAGSHDHVAATARFDGRSWTRYIHDDLSWGIEWRGTLESSDGSVWFSAAVDSSAPARQMAGILQYHEGKWIHHAQAARAARAGVTVTPAHTLPPTQRPEPIAKLYCLGESADGRIWAGRTILIYYDGSGWAIFQRPRETPFNDRFGGIDSMLTTRERALWIGSRQFGAFRYDGSKWERYQGKDSLAANSIYGMAEAADGSIIAATDRGFSRFDGQTWTTDLLPPQLNLSLEGGSIKATSSGALWINQFSPEWNRRAWTKTPPLDETNVEFWTVCHQFSGAPPETTITSGTKEVSQPGNASLLWAGAARWTPAREAGLQFSYRMDGQPWSPYTSEEGRAFFTLPPGRHHFEVRARDRDFNVDPTPASLDFVVLPPVWRQGWFIGLIFALTCLILIQTARVLQDKQRLRKAHDELEERVEQRTAQLAAANKELETFAYSVSHDLRAPLRSIDGFSRALLEDNWEQLDAEGRENLATVRAASQRMGQLIDDLLQLSKVGRSPLRRTRINLSAMAAAIVDELRKQDPKRAVEVIIQPDCAAQADPNLIRIAIENVLENAWKYTSRNPAAKIEFGVKDGAQPPVYFVRDNGVGFDMKYAHKLFGAFQRLHSNIEFPGTGIGLATVQRIIHRHEGRVWIESEVGKGATCYFTLPIHESNT